MAIHIDNIRNYILKQENNSKVQSMPFRILADCDAPVSKYFETGVKVQEDETQKASFRGYPLRGKTVELPEGYIGVVLHESIAPVSDKEERKFHVTNKFKTLTYWNWDKAPSKNDKIIQALDWIDVAEALHSPITEE
ncbi:Ribonuclease H2 subunit C-like Protein [Tribolium castaneum]|uniref:Ribonuclease H2 subunit C-like Protein n=2 Tax=Tribolium castaneum TaxID=7070 RepID=D6WFV5_TRICA|nr:Ribonuclease H2 subunit C-like Protein [Tribolium castaneum]